MSGRRVLLVNPRITSRRSARMPVTLLALAAALEGRYTCRLIDGNMERDYLEALRRELTQSPVEAVGITVMGGPQVRTAIETSLAVRAASPDTPVIWGGYFPTLYTDATLRASYVDYAIRGQGEVTLPELLEALRTPNADLGEVKGLSWKRAERIIHNPDRPFADSRPPGRLPYELLGDPRIYLARTFLGARTVAHQVSLGCRFRCTFCGVAGMFRGDTALPAAERLERDLTWLRNELGADSVQYFDHNFFDREADMLPLLEVLARVQLPWWCYARADALLKLSPKAWALVRRSQLRMAYIGAESPDDGLLRNIRKGTRASQTLAVAELCRRQGVIPELSFMVAPPQDPSGETERTFEFIREVKRVNPEAEIIVYIYTPIPPDSLPEAARVRAASEPIRDAQGAVVHFPQTPEGWTQPQWVDYACHADAPWVSPRLRRRIRSFVTVLGCRFPTVQDVGLSAWNRSLLAALASWRYHLRLYEHPWELNLSRRLIRLVDPRVTGI